jgi:UDP-glucose 4-epimerase
MSNFIPNQTALVTGCAGFIGSNLVDMLLKKNWNVIGIDNFSTGKIEFLTFALKQSNFKLHKVDLKFEEHLHKLMKDVDIVFHLAANADVRFGVEKPRIDLEQNTIVTHNVLEAMRLSNVKKIVFSSTGSVYGDSYLYPTPENAPFPIQTSFYGASKLACEGLIQAYCEAYEMKSWIFRFVSILGKRYTHGHIVDFYKQLILNPHELKVLGNGKQRKSYLHVIDCLSAIEVGLRGSNDKINIFNLGFDGVCEVKDSIEWILERLKINPKITYGTESRGWVGDNPLIHLSIEKISSLGWKPTHTIQEGVESTVDFLIENQWVVK